MSEDPDTAAVRRSMADGLNAYIAQDIEGVVDGYTSDALTIPAGLPAIRGHDEIRAFYSQRMGRYDLDLKYEIEEIVVLPGGGWAYLVGIFFIAGTPRTGGKALEHAGRWLALWRKDEDGVWRMHRDMDSPSPDALRLKTVA